MKDGMATTPEGYMTEDEILDLDEGDDVILLVACEGGDPEGVERTYPAGTPGRIGSMRSPDDDRGVAVTVVVGANPDETIVAVFQAYDGGYAFRRPSANEIETGTETA